MVDARRVRKTLGLVNVGPESGLKMYGLLYVYRWSQTLQYSATRAVDSDHIIMTSSECVVFDSDTVG